MIFKCINELKQEENELYNDRAMGSELRFYKLLTKWVYYS